MNFKHFIRDVPDFPETGVVFKDITPLLEDPGAFRAAAEALYGFTAGLEIDKVVGIESRGFFFAPLLAARLGSGLSLPGSPGSCPAGPRRRPTSWNMGRIPWNCMPKASCPGIWCRSTMMCWQQEVRLAQSVS
jgi:adenine phosphoribosyltransferase